jgi:hypothetical protein
MTSEPRASERRALSLLARSPGNFELLLAARSRSSKFSKVLLSLARPRAFSATIKTLGGAHSTSLKSAGRMLIGRDELKFFFQRDEHYDFKGVSQTKRSWSKFVRVL